AGNSLTSGTANVFVGTNAGGSTNNVTGNTFVGNNAGLFNTAGGSNLFVGGGAGEFNETGSNNVFVGTGSGATNISGNQITLLGIGADVATDGFFNATAIGSGAIVGQNNSLILGSGADVGIGTSTPNANLEISGSGLTFQRISSTSGDVALELFRSGNSNVDYRFFADSSDDFLKLQTSSDDLGTTSDALVIADNGEVGIGINPSSSLHVRHPGSTSNASLGEGISISNATRSTRWTITHQYNILPSLENLEFSFDGTRKGSISQSNGAYSSVSDIRLKKNIGDMADVLNDVMKLRPVNYHFNQQSDQDLANMGFIAQEVLKVFPSLVSGSGKRKSSGEIDYHTMNYAGMSVVSIKAIQEQQKIINQQSIEIEQLKEQLTENSLQHSSTQSELDQLKAQVEMLTNLIKAEASND
ncbi:MAG: tail fiber domain-containing protein, partial [Bacteroidota bacterium]